MDIRTQERTARCHHTKESHVVTLPASAQLNNDELRSKLTITYEPARKVLDVQSLRAYIGSCAEEHPDILRMAEMVEQIAQECANAVGRMVTATAELKVSADQEMIVECVAYYKSEGLVQSGNNLAP